MDRIAVLRPGALGDALATLPVLESLAAARPGAGVMAIGSPAFRLAAECGLAAGWVSFDDARLVGLFAEGGTCELFAGCVLCIHYGRRPDPQLEANLTRSGARRAVFWPCQPASTTHIVDHLLGALDVAGVPAATRVPRLPPQRCWLDAGRAFLEANGLPSDFVAVHPGSGGRAKRWPASRFAALAEQLGGPVVWLLGPAEAEDEGLRELGERAGAVADGLPLPTLAGLLASCRVYVGNDSGVSHLAAAVGAPTVALFGATDPRLWAPRGPRVAVLDGWKDGGLDTLTADRVVAAAREAARLSPPPPR
jgi:ADP-heptose:LPS heptosyltransferase